MKDLNVVIKGNNVKITDSLRCYVNEKIGKLTKFFESIKSADVELMVEKNKTSENSQKVEVTLNVNGTIFRCEESTISMYASIDIASEKLERQLKKHKERLYYKSRVPKGKEVIAGDFPVLEELDAETKIVKVKKFAIKPMDPEEASLQMELLNHDFFVFLNPESEEVNVIYKRNDGNYGLIEPELE